MGANRTAQEQHPFHLHGHHFWLLGQGVGLWEEVAGNASGVLNTANPPYRDSFTVAKGGWVVLRFAVSMPCHQSWRCVLHGTTADKIIGPACMRRRTTRASGSCTVTPTGTCSWVRGTFNQC